MWLIICNIYLVDDFWLNGWTCYYNDDNVSRKYETQAIKSLFEGISTAYDRRCRCSTLRPAIVDQYTAGVPSGLVLNRR
jgi:hypothetical protein